MNPHPDGTELDSDPFIQDCLSDLIGKRPTGQSDEWTDDSKAECNENVLESEKEILELTQRGPLAAKSNISVWVGKGERESMSKWDDVQQPVKRRRQSAHSDLHPMHLATSTFISLAMVLALLLVARLIVPSMVENIRYGWYRGQLRAEYELSGERLQSVSLDSLADVSQLVSRRAGPSVVHINLLSDREAIDGMKTLYGDRPHPSFKYQGQGSGFVIDSGGYILTNHHVVGDGGSIEVTLSDGRQLPAELVGADPLTDLAVLKVAANDLMPVDWGESESVVVGTPVWAVGSPFGLQQTVTFGIISGKHRVDFRGSFEAQAVNAGTPYSDLMQSDVALNPGNSGGPLMNSLGQVIGVNAAILGETFRGVSFSIPSRVARSVAEQLIAGGEVSRGWLGVRLEDLPDEDRFGDDGVPLAGVRVAGFPDRLSSPAKRAGIKRDDKILSFEGAKVASSADLIRMIGETPAGKTVLVGIERKKQQLTIEVILDRRAAEIR